MAYIKTPWADDVTPISAQKMNNIEQGVASAMPTGGIIMWSGSIANIPAAWALCDGSGGTPDLRNRFIVGAGSTYPVDATGGADTVALSQNQMPSHGHSFSATSGTGGTHDHRLPIGTTMDGKTGVQYAIDNGNYMNDDSGPQLTARAETGGSHTHSVSGTSGSAGSGSAHENRPPYLALAYIMKL